MPHIIVWLALTCDSVLRPRTQDRKHLVTFLPSPHTFGPHSRLNSVKRHCRVRSRQKRGAKWLATHSYCKLSLLLSLNLFTCSNSKWIVSSEFFIFSTFFQSLYPFPRRSHVILTLLLILMFSLPGNGWTRITVSSSLSSSSFLSIPPCPPLLIFSVNHSLSPPLLSSFSKFSYMYKLFSQSCKILPNHISQLLLLSSLLKTSKKHQ